MANAMIDARQAGGSYRRVEVITGERRRRRWTGEEKARIVAESFEEGANISEVARRNGGSRGLLTVWRRQVAAAVAGNAPSFVPLQIRAESGGGTAVEDKPTELTATWCDLNSAPAYSKPETAERRGAVELRFMTARVFYRANHTADCHGRDLMDEGYFLIRTPKIPIRMERFIVPALSLQQSATRSPLIQSPKAKAPTGHHFAQCPAEGLKRPQMLSH